MNSLALRAVLACLVSCAAQSSEALELLDAVGFEVASSEVPFWTLEEFFTGAPGSAVNSAQLVGFGNNPTPGSGSPGAGLWLRPFVGNPTDGTAEALLSQVVPANPGELYTLRGDALFEQNYAGGVDLLDPLSPFGAIASPTENLFELAFLDASGSPIGTPLVRDVSDSVFNGFGYFSVTPLSGTAPAGAVSARVRAIGSKLAFNIDPGQSAFYDNFSLTTANAPNVELLANGDLNQEPPSAEDLYEFVESPSTSDSLLLASFANNPATGGETGVWVRPFVLDAESAAVRQTAPAIPGLQYTFSASARFESNYAGDDRSGANETLIELAFLDAGGSIVESVSRDLRDDGKSADDLWTTHTLTAVAPAGAVDVRVAGIVNNLTSPGLGAASAFWDDFSLTVVIPEPTSVLFAAVACIGAIASRRRT